MFIESVCVDDAGTTQEKSVTSGGKDCHLEFEVMFGREPSAMISMYHKVNFLIYTHFTDHKNYLHFILSLQSCM